MEIWGAYQYINLPVETVCILQCVLKGAYNSQKRVNKKYYCKEYLLSNM